MSRIGREVTVTTRLVLDDKLSSGLDKSKIAADKAAVSVERLKSASASAGAVTPRAAVAAAGLTPLTAAAATVPIGSLAATQAARTAADSAAATTAGIFNQQNNQMAERIAKIQRVAGLAAGALAVSGVSGPAANVAGATLGGAAAGAVFGPWGIALGAALGGVPAIIGAIGDSAEKAKAAVEKLRSEAGKTASEIFSREAEIRRLRGGGEVTAASLAAAAPTTAAVVAGLSPADASAALRRAAEVSAGRLRTAEAMARETTTETFWSRLGGPGRIFAPRAATPEEMSSRRAELEAARLEAMTLASAAVRGIAGVTRPEIAGIAAGGSGGAGFISESITSALLGGGPEDRSVDLLTEIRDLLRGHPA